MKILKCLIAIAASAYGSIYVLGIGLVGTGDTPLSRLLLIVLGVSLIAGGIHTSRVPSLSHDRRILGEEARCRSLLAGNTLGDNNPYHAAFFAQTLLGREK
jgi:hypothetical protein